MLTGGVAGAVFASPPTASILAGIRAVARDNTGRLHRRGGGLEWKT